MFTSVTWSQFLSAAALLLAVYYLTVLLTCYRKQLHQRLAGLLRRKAAPATGGIMGPAAPGDMTYTSVAALQVAPPEGRPVYAPAVASSLPEGALSELVNLLQETEILVAHAAATDSPKEDFLSLLRLLAANSPALAQSPYRQPVLLLLQVQCQGRLSFDLSPEDLQQLWVRSSN
jgi:hypothetical protein